MKRDDYITWQEYFMGHAILASQRSKDPNSQVGACIVDPKNRVISCGYNGFPNGISDDALPWDRGDGKNLLDLNTKYPYVVHAEPNAILNSHGQDMTDATLYVTLFPCHECAKLVIQAGIKHMIYYDDKYDGTDSNTASKKLFDLAGVKYEKYTPTKREINFSV